MGKEDWYRNDDWNVRIEAEFRAKLGRARTRAPQYLWIQASYLANGHPQVALDLIDEYFQTGDQFDTSSAYCVRAEALLSVGRVEDAISAYKKALDWEVSHPNNLSPARIDFPKFVATRRIRSEYDSALNILTERFKPEDHELPITRYDWNGSAALITFEMGHFADAREHAERALRAAAATRSPYANHPSVGLVGDTSDDFGRRLKELAGTSSLRLGIQRLFSRFIGDGPL